MTGIEEVAATIQTQHDNKSANSELDLFDASKKLTEGLLTVYQMPLEHVKQELHELTSIQESCFAQMQLENRKLCDVQEDIELNNMFSSMETYQEKLINIKKDIITIHERIFKLKKRALKFQEVKQKEMNQ